MFDSIETKLESLQENLELRNDDLIKLLVKIKSNLLPLNDMEDLIDEVGSMIKVIKKDDEYKQAKIAYNNLPKAEKEKKRKNPEPTYNDGDLYGEIEHIIEIINDPEEINVSNALYHFATNGNYSEIEQALVEHKASNQRLVTLGNINDESWFEEFQEKVKNERPSITIE